jgi:superfamily II DNA/RNA helicase
MGPYLSRGKKLLVFCNTVDSSRAVEYYCREQGLSSVCYNGEMTVAARQESMAKFSAAGQCVSCCG